MKEKKIGFLPPSINQVIPVPNKDAVRISKLVKHRGSVTGYELSDGQIVSREEGVSMAKGGGIRGVAVATNKGTEYLRTLPDDKENNNLGNLPSITQ